LKEHPIVQVRKGEGIVRDMTDERLVTELQMDVGAADKAAILLVKVQPYQSLVSDT